MAAAVLLAGLTAGSSVDETAHRNQWQYFCFDSAQHFAAVATKSVFSVLPNPDGRTRTKRALADSEPPPEPAAATVLSSAAKLKPLEGACFFLRVGYWTYEACPFVSIRQYHSESGAAGKPNVHVEYSLGKYAQLGDEFQESSGVYTQNFEGGTEGRSASVRYLCPDSWRDEDGIVVVNEPRPKHYVVTLRVKALCGEKDQPRASARSATIAGVAGRPPAGTGNNMPAAAAAVAAKAQKAAAVASSSSTTMQIAEMNLPNTRLLSSLRGRCFSMASGYWTYEFCPQQHVRQFRKEGNRIGVEFSLGSYDRLADKITVGVRGRLDKSFVPHTFTQAYLNGTANRRAHVRVRCSQKNEHTLLAVEEPATHDYVVIFSSPLGCELGCAYASVQAHEGDNV